MRRRFDKVRAVKAASRLHIGKLPRAKVRPNAKHKPPKYKTEEQNELA